MNHFRNCYGLALSFAVFVVLILTPGAWAQTYTVLHNFTLGADGGNPEAGLVMDRAGNLYGTSTTGGGPGDNDWGNVFELARKNSGWTLIPLYIFHGNDGGIPRAGLTIGPDGSLYGTTSAGGDFGCSDGGGLGCGTVFKVKHPARAVGSSPLSGWDETVLHQFEAAPSDGDYPWSKVTFDAAGNLYGTTYYGGNGGGQGVGTVYELSPGENGWTESIVYNFNTSVPHGPASEVTFDAGGNLYGTGVSIYPDGGVYELTPSVSGWVENTLHIFGIDDLGNAPYAGVTFDHAGNLYSATAYGGTDSSGWAYELSPSGSGWTSTSIYSFPYFGVTDNRCYGPMASLTMDSAGNLYGTTCGDGAYSYGSVFKLTPSNDGWTYTSLHDFTGGDDGGFPYGGVVVDANGNVFGTTSEGGTLGAGRFAYGVIFEISPN